LAVVDGEVRLTYGQLAERAHRLAAALQALGAGPGDRVALFARNSFRAMELHLACAIAGVILLPLNIRLAKAELEFILRESGTRLLFCALSLETSVCETMIWDDGDPVSKGVYEENLSSSSSFACPAQQPADIAQIFYTSGTTGAPKGVSLSHRNLVASAIDAVIGLEMCERDVWLHASPMFHLLDAFAIWGATLVGATHVIAHFEPKLFGPLVQRERVTKTSLPPTLLDKIVRESDVAAYDLRSLACISYGGSPMPEATYGRCFERLGCRLLQAYGLTEGSGFVCHETPRDNPDPALPMNTVGRPTVHAEIELLDDTGRPVERGQIGEICLRGDRVMREYWANPAATDSAFANGWYRSGDLGVQDAEGRYRVVGRKKEMIISGGENVYPAEVVNALLSHPKIEEAAVFGIPSQRWGEEVCAVVYPLRGDAAALTTDELLFHCRGLVGGYKVPKAIHISNEPLPKSGPGKIATSVVRTRYVQGTN
jgi:long-chain acyl-CoA synthetase